MNKELRIFAGAIITESKLTTSAKKQLLSFVKEQATDAQVKVLLMDGEIVSLDKTAEKIVNQRWPLSEAGGRVAKLRKSYMSQAASGSGMDPLWLIYRTIRSKFDICTKRCGSYEINTTRRQHCMIKCKVEKLKRELLSAEKSGNKNEIEKKKIALTKAQNTLKKSIDSFKKRGADE